MQKSKLQADFYDTIALIAGGGPAGSSAAIKLTTSNIPTVLVEKSNYNNTRIGEMLSPNAKPILSELGIFEDFTKRNHLISRGIRSFWGSNEDYIKEFIFNPYGYGWHLYRKEFDSDLARSAEARSCSILKQTKIVSVSNYGEYYITTLINNCNENINIKSKYIIDATGRSAEISRRFGVSNNIYDRLVGFASLFEPIVQNFIPNPVTTIESAESGWWYAVPLGNGDFNVVYMTDLDLYSKGSLKSKSFWLNELQRTNFIFSLLQNYKQKSKPRGFMSDTYICNISEDSIHKNFLPVGSAIIGLDPLSSDGICFAMRSGIDAAKFIISNENNGELQFKNYFSRIKEHFGNYLAERSENYKLERRWQNSLFWQRRHRVDLPPRFTYNPSR